jgi:hypothetical protein
MRKMLRAACGAAWLVAGLTNIAFAEGDADRVVDRDAVKRFAMLPNGVRFPEGITADPDSGEVYVGTFDFTSPNKLLRFGRHGQLLAQIDFNGTPLLGLEFDRRHDKVYIAMTMQRMVVNQMILDPGLATGNWWPTPPPGTPPLLNVKDVLRFATINGAKHLRLDGKTGSLTPGKEADIIILDATAPNVTPLNNVPGAVVSLMDTSNVETVIVAGKVRKWKGKLLDVDMDHLRRQLERSRDFIFAKAGVAKNLFPH